MTGLLLLLMAVFFGMLLLEARRARRDRKSLAHVVYVNGIRGKSSVTRLIDAGLRAGGWRVFCKTTGTLPMLIGTDGVERLIRRRGCANIREQLMVLHRAASEDAQVLVLECMAVDPVLQAVSQHRMVCADLGVITNVRLDHTDVMGETHEEIADALAHTIPRAGLLFTAEQEQLARLQAHAELLGTRTVGVTAPAGLHAEIDFPENIALALAVCSHLGIPEAVALEGMRGYQRDPYALSLHRMRDGAVFVNGLSINDPQSTMRVFEELRGRQDLGTRRVVLLLNNRPDRVARTVQMAELACAMRPDELWLLGAGTGILRRTLRRALGAALMPVCVYRRAEQLPLHGQGARALIFAAGNIALQGKPLMERVRQEGDEYVL